MQHSKQIQAPPPVAQACAVSPNDGSRHIRRDAGTGVQGGSAMTGSTAEQAAPAEEEDPNRQSIQMDWEINAPEWKEHNWSVNSTAHMFHVFFACNFTILKDTCCNAGQTPQDRFWQAVCWLFNYGFSSDWFHPQNKIWEKVKKVASINPCHVGS